MFLPWLIKPLAAATAIVFSTLGVLSRRYQRARFYFHLSIYIGTLGLLSAWGVVISLFAPLIGQRLNINYIVARSFYHTCGPLIGIEIEVEGGEHLTNLQKANGGKGQSAVLLGNHQSALDILYLGRIFPRGASIMAKQELKWSPILVVALSGAVFVDRRNRHDAVKAIQKAGDDMKKKGISLWIFPEGTRSMSAECNLLPFKKGAFHLAIQAQVPIVAIVCENYHRLFDRRTRMESGRLRIKVLPPISTAGLTVDDVSSLAESTRRQMLETLIQISSPRPTQPSPSPSSSIDDLETPRAEFPPVLDMTKQRLTSTRQENRSDGSEEKGGSELSLVDSRGGETTEDEMDEDAVLLKRPKTI
ncbi:lysophosphatidate acyltransferase [Tremella mesenterica]|uniref:1-acyl-sn-glycerol-3-phosphate acyltransferase n=1 Tax=Tremella mesenterica TaxID=5217 RepID=A0A4Q1BGG1_TREME|nr:lysophosphatidate acyltransferase [Tremella mesenterica]